MRRWQAGDRPRRLYVIACGAGPAVSVHDLVERALSRGWDVWVGATPDGRALLDGPRLEALTGHEVRSHYQRADTQPWPPADAIVVAPATLNSINKLAAGIADNWALSLLTECIGLDVPILIVPNVNPALARHPRFAASLATLRGWQLQVLYHPSAPPPVWMASWAEILDTLDTTPQP